MKLRHWIPLILSLAALGFLALQNKTRAASRLLPFQGRLTDAQGNSIGDGLRVVQFKIYDAPVGGSAVWNGEVQKLTVNAGLVSTLLGTKANLASVDFDRELYLELTVDANNDGQITPADPPLLPRQNILPAVFAKEAADSRLLAGYDWTPLFGVNDPTSTLLPVRIADGSVPSTKLIPASITATQIALKTITAAKLADATITAAQIAPGTITRDRLEASLTIDSIIPPGTVNAFAGTSVPSGWLLCDGSALDKERLEYARLFDAIQQSWGNGSQSAVGAIHPAIPSGVNQTDFNIPDLRGHFLRGVSGGTTRDPDRDFRTSSSAGGNPGNAVGSIQGSQAGQHTHGAGTAVANGSLAARANVNANGNVNIEHRTIGAWTGNDKKAYAGTGTDNEPGITRGAIVVGATAINNANTTESRPVNAYVHYIIKL